MTKWIDVSGKTEDEAIASGLKSLGLDRDDVSVEILERAKSGFLGLGSSPAVVRLTYETAARDDFGAPPLRPAAPPPPPKQESRLASAKQAPRTSPSPAPPKRPVSAPPPPVSQTPIPQAPAPATGVPDPLLDKRAQGAEEFVTGLLKHMGVQANVGVAERDGGLILSLSGPGMGAVIGHGGEALDAIQHLTNYTVNRGAVSRLRISVDAENYRQKREDALVSLAQKTAAKAVKYKRSMALEPMNSYERHVVHTALQDYPDVSTSSTGVEPRRRVVVSYTKEPSNPQQKGNPRVREWS
ncbi:MAG: protein jag [Firmicutes bacterium]|nr:protein jag [Bacillota bacterium]